MALHFNSRDLIYTTIVQGMGNSCMPRCLRVPNTFAHSPVHINAPPNVPDYLGDMETDEETTEGSDDSEQQMDTLITSRLNALRRIERQMDDINNRTVLPVTADFMQRRRRRRTVRQRRVPPVPIQVGPELPPPPPISPVSEEESTKVFHAFVCEGDLEDECVICQEKVEKGDSAIALNCNEEKFIFHTFHETCISTWLKQNNTCPMCRVKIL